MRPDRGFAEVNGTRLYYDIAGEGEPLVLLHGFSLDTRVWQPQVQAFARDHRVVRYDLRGFGRSDPPDGTGYFHHQDLAALLDWLGMEAATLLGHSTGGSIALDFAVAHPERTRGLILFGAIAGGYEFSPEFAAALGAIFQAAREQGVDVAKARWRNLLAYQPEDPDDALDLDEILVDYSGWHWLNADPVLALEPPALQRLDAIRSPVLTLLGEREVPDCHNIARIVNEAVPTARHVVLPGLGHMANLEAPGRFNRAVLDFLARAES